MNKIVLRLAFLLVILPTSLLAVASDGDWWSECAVSAWDGTCGSVETCCLDKLESCQNDAYVTSSPFDPNFEQIYQDKLTKCNNRYRTYCIPGALTCVDDPNS